MYTRTQPPCPFCTQAKNLAEIKNIVYENIDVSSADNMQNMKQQYPAARTVPLILIDGEVIGGFAEFKNYILTKELGEMSI
jgi:glutaredoxin